MSLMPRQKCAQLKFLTPENSVYLISEDSGRHYTKAHFILKVTFLPRQNCMELKILQSGSHCLYIYVTKEPGRQSLLKT
jgi:hypothetical protein